MFQAFLIVILVLIGGAILWSFLTWKPERYPFYKGRQVEIVSFDYAAKVATVRFDDDTEADAPLERLVWVSE